MRNTLSMSPGRAVCFRHTRNLGEISESTLDKNQRRFVDFKSLHTMSENTGLPKPGVENGRHSVLHEHPLGKVLDLSQQSHQRQIALNPGDELQGPSTDPRLWKRTDVSDWLLWAVRFYQVDDVDPSKFAMNGRGLCLLTMSGFMNRAPSCGDILHSDFQRRYAVAVVRTERERRTNRRRLQVCFDVDPTAETKRPKLAEDK